MGTVVLKEHNNNNNNIVLLFSFFLRLTVHEILCLWDANDDPDIMEISITISTPEIKISDADSREQEFNDIDCLSRKQLLSKTVGSGATTGGGGLRGLNPLPPPDKEKIESKTKNEKVNKWKRKEYLENLIAQVNQTTSTGQ